MMIYYDTISGVRWHHDGKAWVKEEEGRGLAAEARALLERMEEGSGAVGPYYVRGDVTAMIRRLVAEMETPSRAPRFYPGDRVYLLPCDRVRARVTDLHWHRDGLEYDVRYFDGGKSCTARVFEDELEERKREDGE